MDFCRFLGYERPKAAALCAVETVNPAMPETGDALSLKEAGERGNSVPVSWKAHLSGPGHRPRGGSGEGLPSPVAGDADILLVPAIAVGNVLGKALYGLAGGQMAGVVLGAAVPITINSRGPRRRRNITLSCSAPPWIRRKLTCPTRS